MVSYNRSKSQPKGKYRLTDSKMIYPDGSVYTLYDIDYHYPLAPFLAKDKPYSIASVIQCCDEIIRDMQQGRIDSTDYDLWKLWRYRILEGVNLDGDGLLTCGDVHSVFMEATEKFNWISPEALYIGEDRKWRYVRTGERMALDRSA